MFAQLEEANLARVEVHAAARALRPAGDLRLALALVDVEGLAQVEVGHVNLAAERGVFEARRREAPG